MKKTIIILSGIPCSGKSTFARSQEGHIPILSCDTMRHQIFGAGYKHNSKGEERVWNSFYFQVANQRGTFIVDNTNCKKIYIDRLKEIHPDWPYTIIRFDCTLNQAYYRNIKRYLLTGKWIPIAVIKNMKKNYDNLWKE